MWYVIWTTTGKEEQCKALLEHYCNGLFERISIPTKIMQKKYQDVWKEVEIKLIPSYVFVETGEVFEFGAELKRLSWFAGFNNILKSDGTYAPLNERDAAFIEHLCGKDDVIKPSFAVKEGDRITVTEGALVGYEGFITKIDRHKRQAYVELDMFGRKVKVALGIEVLDKK